MKLPRPTLKKARIEIIPMIDTIFFLLVFFMFSSLQRVSMSAPQVALPHSTSAAGKTTKKVVLTVDRSGVYYIDKATADFADILPELKKRIEQDDDLVVVINADKTQQVGEIQKLIDIAKQSNPAKLYIATAPDDKPGEDIPEEDQATVPGAPEVQIPRSGSVPAALAAPTAPVAPGVPAK